MLKAHLSEAIDAVRTVSDVVPEIALVLGSGLGPLADEIEGVEIPYRDIPHFPVSTAPGHDGVLLLGTLFGRRCVAMRGRVHMYEGYSAQDVTFPTRLMAALGAKTAIFTNAAGGMADAFEVGDLAVIEDHLSLPIACGGDPLRGPNDDDLGPRFVSMNQAYDPSLIALAKSLDPALKAGVYAHVVGPSFEPPALIRLLHAAGCNLVGMSTVPEVVVARHAGQKVLAISAVTNLAVADIASSHITNEEEVWDAVKIVQPKLLSLMENLLPTLMENLLPKVPATGGAS